MPTSREFLSSVAPRLQAIIKQLHHYHKLDFPLKAGETKEFQAVTATLREFLSEVEQQDQVTREGAYSANKDAVNRLKALGGTIARSPTREQKKFAEGQKGPYEQKAGEIGNLVGKIIGWFQPQRGIYAPDKKVKGAKHLGHGATGGTGASIVTWKPENDTASQTRGR